MTNCYRLLLGGGGGGGDILSILRLGGGGAFFFLPFNVTSEADATEDDDEFLDSTKRRSEVKGDIGRSPCFCRNSFGKAKSFRVSE